MGYLPSTAILALAATLFLPIYAVPVLHGHQPPEIDANSSDDGILVYRPVTDLAADKRVRDYWTADRLANIDSDERLENRPPFTDEDLSVGQEYPGGGGIKTTVGRLLYTSFELDTNDTVDSSCTATLVESENESTLTTAAHCVHAGISPFYQGFNDNLLWIPGFRDGEFPLGSFTVNSIVLYRLWTEEASFEDRTFIVLNHDAEGRAAAETLGQGQHVEFHTGLPTIGAQRWHLGYTRYLNGEDEDARKGSPAFTGDRLASCNGSTEEFSFVPSLYGVPCRMGGGASGGPNFEDFDVETGYGTVIGVNNIAFGTPNPDGEGSLVWTFSSNITDAASEKLWETAQSISVQPL